MLLEPHGAVVRDSVPAPFAADIDERAARRDLRGQIAHLERDLTECVQRGFPFARVDGASPQAARPAAGPQVLGLAALEGLRDDLVERLRRARQDLDRQEAEHELHRQRLEDMLANPRAFKWARVARRDIGEPGCGVWEVRPRLGLVGMLAGWWHVTVSSGCPLATAATIPAVGRRSRKRSSADLDTPIPASPDAAARRALPLSPKARREDAPEAPWGGFPLVEICIFVGILLIVWGFLTHGDRRGVLVSGGVGLICVASLELTVREHLAGFRSHTTLLACAAAVLVMAPLWFLGLTKIAVAGVGAVVGVLAFTALRRVFVRKAGGLGFRA